MTAAEQIADEIYGLHCDIGRLEQENATLRRQLEDASASMGRMEERYAKTFEVGKRWMARAARLESENTKLQELVRSAVRCIADAPDCDSCALGEQVDGVWVCRIIGAAKELRVKVDE